MPFPLVALALGASALGAASSIIGGNKAAKAQKKAADAQIAETRRQYDTTRADYAPWRAAGESALGRITTDMTDPTHSAFIESPGYNFRRDQSLKAIERMQGARGLWNSGATRTALMERAGNLASEEYGNWWNRNAGIAGIGQAATGATAAAGQGATAMINNAYQQQGNARASSYANTSSAVNSGINNVLSAYLFSRGGGFGGAQ